ncbi:MAG: CusA/CzcA family heavy metal efflux RND transporter [Pseudomonadota bacterium]
MGVLAAIVSWSLANRPVVLLATLLCALLGLRAASTLSIDAVPDITNVQVQVITSAPALSPVEVEQYVTTPVERAMAGIPKTTEIRSLSKYGISLVTVVFEDGTDIYFARQLVSERMREAQELVPLHYGRPEMGPISSGLGEIYQFTVNNPKLDLMQIEELLDWQIAPALRTVPGIVEVNSFGGEDRQYQVVLDPKRLQAAGVSIVEVANALKKSNANAGGGYIEHNREHFVISTDGLVKSIDDLRGVVIGATAQGVPITIATVGDAQFGPRLRRGAASKDGRGEVAVGVALMLLGENPAAVTASVREKLAAIQSSLPAGTVVEAFYDRSQLVDRTIHTVTRNLLEGALLVIFVLLILLGDLRAGLVVATSIPLALLFAVSAMKLFGLSGNLMSLGAIDFGLIVDGAVIIVENAVRRLAEAANKSARPLSGDERCRVVAEATLEVRSASVFGEAIIAIVYLPILALSGVEGKLFRPMATTVLFALFGAFLLSLTLIPVLTSYIVRPKQGAHETWLIKRARALYTPVLDGTLRHRLLAVSVSVFALAGAALLFTRIGAEFVPQLDEGDVLVEARRLPGVALTESVAMDQRIQQAILKVPEVMHVVSKTGAPELATDPMGMEQSDVYIALKDREAWRSGLTKAQIGDQISALLQAEVPEVSGAISQPIQMRTSELVAGVRSDVAALIYGPDLARLADLGGHAAELIRNIPGVRDVRVQQISGLRYLRITPDRKRLARYGLTIDDVNQLSETFAVGHSVGDVLEGDRRFGIVVKTKHDFDGNLAPLRALPLKSLTGQIVPLGDVAELAFATGPAEISRDKQSRRITVEFNVRERDLLSTVSEAQSSLARGLHLPTGYHSEWGGQFKHYGEAKARLLVVVPLSLALIGFLLWMTFRSTRVAALIFLNVPFSAIGGVVALWLRDIPFSISAGVGFIALFGVAVLNGLVLVSFARHLEDSGMSHAAAIKQAAEARLRPVLMTALVASLGFIPMALSTAPGSEVQRPLATVVIGGIVSATLLTMLLLPVIYSFFKPPSAPGSEQTRSLGILGS